MTNIYMDYLTESEREELILKKEIDLINTDIDYLFTTYEAVEDDKKQGVLKRIIEKLVKLISRLIKRIEKFLADIKENNQLIQLETNKYVVLQNIDKVMPRFKTLQNKIGKAMETDTVPSGLEDELRNFESILKRINRDTDTDRVHFTDDSLHEIKYSKYKEYKSFLTYLKDNLTNVGEGISFDRETSSVCCIHYNNCELLIHALTFALF